MMHQKINRWVVTPIILTTIFIASAAIAKSELTTFRFELLGSQPKYKDFNIGGDGDVVLTVTPHSPPIEGAQLCVTLDAIHPRAEGGTIPIINECCSLNGAKCKFNGSINLNGPYRVGVFVRAPQASVVKVDGSVYQ